MKSSLNDLNSKIVGLNNHIGELEQLKNNINNNKMSDVQIANKKFIEEQQQEIRDLRNELAIMKDKETEQETGSDQVQEIKALQNMLLEKTNEIAEIAEERKELQIKVQLLQEECDSLRNQNSTMKEELQAKESADKVSLYSMHVYVQLQFKYILSHIVSLVRKRQLMLRG